MVIIQIILILLYFSRSLFIKGYQCNCSHINCFFVKRFVTKHIAFGIIIGTKVNLEWQLFINWPYWYVDLLAHRRNNLNLLNSAQNYYWVARNFLTENVFFRAARSTYGRICYQWIYSTIQSRQYTAQFEWKPNWSVRMKTNWILRKYCRSVYHILIWNHTTVCGKVRFIIIRIRTSSSWDWT